MYGWFVSLLKLLYAIMFSYVSSFQEPPLRPYALGFRGFRPPRTMRWYLHSPKPTPAWYNRSLSSIVTGFCSRVYNDVLLTRVRNIVVLIVGVLVGCYVGYRLAKNILRAIKNSSAFRKRKLEKLFQQKVFCQEDLDSGAYKKEALVEGSELRSATHYPSCQIQLCDQENNHIGFGIRVADSLMVVPTHVWTRFSGRMVSLVGPTAVQMMNYFDGYISKICPDLMYLSVKSQIFVNIGVRRAALRKERGGINLVSCTGFDGVQRTVSMGSTQISKLLGFINYSGSTVPGFSGAAYMSGGTVVGMHSGAVVDANCGVESSLIVEELKVVITTELSDFKTVELMAARLHNDEYENYADIVADAYDSEDEEDDIVRYNRLKKIGKLESLSTAAAEILTNATKLSASEKEKLVRTMTAHSPGAGRVEIETPNSVTQFLNDTMELVTKCEARINDLTECYNAFRVEISARHNRLMERVEGCENQVQVVTDLSRECENQVQLLTDQASSNNIELRGRMSTCEADVIGVRESMLAAREVEKETPKVPEQPAVVEKSSDSPPNPEKPLKCSHCNRWFKTESFRAVHAKAAHKELVGESAFAADTKVTVNRNFQKGPLKGPLQKRNGRNSSSNFAMFEKLDRLESIMERLCDTLTPKK